MLFRAALRERLATAVPDFWANQHIFMKIEGERAKLIAHGKGELGVLNFRQILPDNLTPTTALDLLTSKGYTLKERNVDIASEGVVDIYEKKPAEFNWRAKIILVKSVGAATRLVIPASVNGGTRVENPENFTPKTAHTSLSGRGYALKNRFEEDPDEGLVDVYEFQAPVFDWERAKLAYVSCEGSQAKIILPEDGVIPARQEHPDAFNPKTAHEALIAHGFTIKDRFAEVGGEGTVDIYEKKI